MIFINQPLTGLISSLMKLFNWKFFWGLIVPVGIFGRKLAKVFVRMISVSNQIELLRKLPALNFLSRSQSTIAMFPKRFLLQLSEKSALLLQSGCMELANWGRKTFLRNCKPKFLQKTWLNFFNQFFFWHFFTSTELLASLILSSALQIGNFMRPVRQNFQYWMSRP